MAILDEIKYILLYMIEYIFCFFLILIFFIYGLILSEWIDHFFHIHNEEKEEPIYLILFETVGEIGIAYIIYYLFQQSIYFWIQSLCKILVIQTPSYFQNILFISFSIGIFRHLDKSSQKIKYLQQKAYQYIF